MPKAVWEAQELATDPHQRGDKPQKVQAMFSAIAGAYDLNNRLHSFGLDERWRKAAVRAARVRAGDDIVDIACGTGDLTEQFAGTPARSVLGLDFTPAMLDIARVKSARRKHPNAVPRYEHGDATALALPDASADVVSIAFGLRNVGAPERALAEFRRVLRPGGRLVVLEFDEPTNPVIRTMNRLYTHRIMPWTASLIARDRSGAYRYLPRSVETFLDRQRLREAMLAADFSSVEQIPLTFGTCVVSVATVAQ
ncbi:MAG: bifunctional demethylmenaquinone methyltransferase/2-methoxy-6-polyprenyl-1,4-benzoquinol methylase UbiE [Planctomycetaceae bacterium]|nr:bifunctional demethylmenaquinone methyltransferase/2-methoxy-6-polyprenyl-1,4-benzoquinol methylase UbiE [Planctomycetaceae bacterium]